MAPVSGSIQSVGSSGAAPARKLKTHKSNQQKFNRNEVVLFMMGIGFTGSPDETIRPQVSTPARLSRDTWVNMPANVSPAPPGNITNFCVRHQRRR